MAYEEAEALVESHHHIASVGLLLVFYVNEGIFKAILGGRMEWFMLNKLGNKGKVKVDSK